MQVLGKSRTSEEAKLQGPAWATGDVRPLRAGARSTAGWRTAWLAARPKWILGEFPLLAGTFGDAISLAGW